MAEHEGYDWVEQAQRGDAAAVAGLYRRYWRAARATAYGVTGNLPLAKDAASEALLSAMSSLPKLRNPDRFGPWLRTIVVRTARRLRRAASAPNGFAPQMRPDPSTAGPGTRLEQQELAVLIRAAVEGLPAALREAVCLFYFEGYSVEDAARFVGVPCGTFKRRLHDGRRRLYAGAERILEGSKPMDPEREQIVKELREAMAEGPDSEAFYQVMRQITALRPVPRELLQEFRNRHLESIRKRGQTPLLSPEQERAIRASLRQVYEPSARACDPNHPVGAAADAIRAVLTDFQAWQVNLSEVNLAERARHLFESRAETLSYLLPPDFAEKSRGAYISAERALLIRDEDGSVLTMGELLAKKATQEKFREQMKTGGCMSDALGLLWKQPGPLELRIIEELLRRLADQVVPDTPVRFRPYEEPRYRAALRMQLGDDPIPGAIGGVLRRWSILPEGVDVASVTLYLEPWASARSDQAIELTPGTPFPSLKRQDRD